MSSEPESTTGPLTPDLAGLRRLERRIVRVSTWRAAGRRVWESLPAILQIVAAALASYAIAHYAVGHATPIMAVTVVVSSLGLTLDARPIRVLQSVLGILLGVALAVGLEFVAGKGWWQLGVVLLLVMALGRLLVKNPAFPVAAAIPAALTIVLPVNGSAFDRVIDAGIGGAIALLATALIPRDPRRTALRDGHRLYSVLVESTTGTVDALRTGDSAAGELALSRLRRTQELVDAWAQSLETARSIARISPWLRARLPELDRHLRALRGGDHAARHLRLIARRAEFMVRDGVRHEALSGLIDEFRGVLELIALELDDVQLAGAARNVLWDLTARLGPAAVPRASVAESALIVQLRPLAVDLLVATGVPLAEAQARLPAL